MHDVANRILGPGVGLGLAGDELVGEINRSQSGAGVGTGECFQERAIDTRGNDYSTFVSNWYKECENMTDWM